MACLCHDLGGDCQPLQHVTVMLSLSGSDQARVAADVTALHTGELHGSIF